MYRCANPECGATWPSDTPGPPECPKCGDKGPEATLDPEPTGIKIGASATLTADYALDSQRLTVLALLLTIGLTVGFGIGGGWGVPAGFGTPLLLALAFRNRRLRNRLAKLADWATEPK